ncbi:ribosome silencing factor [Acholeplasma vituli]|uniref:Ribosome silencing factor n=1 Tax=Paracholeplasma vituli TaxID=69473 RepID=A0ABT2PWR1_9MOLU|nr:ribosome silencing factor [Paracholeplasma vituli]MCU0105390.1 ribosome silencing factor [Paracholeplasma vituli]
MELLEKIIKTIDIVKVSDVKIYDMEKSSPFFDYVVVATANERQSIALITYLKESVGTDQIRGFEGKTGGWLLVDLGDVVLHLFSKEMREYYGFDKRLMTLKQIEIKA